MNKQEILNSTANLAVTIISGADYTVIKGRFAGQCAHRNSENKITLGLDPDGKVFCTECNKTLFTGSLKEAGDFIMLVEAWIDEVVEANDQTQIAITPKIKNNAQKIKFELPLTVSDINKIYDNAEPALTMLPICEVAKDIQLSFKDKNKLREKLNEYKKITSGVKAIVNYTSVDCKDLESEKFYILRNPGLKLVQDGAITMSVDVYDKDTFIRRVSVDNFVFGLGANRHFTANPTFADSTLHYYSPFLFQDDLFSDMAFVYNSDCIDHGVRINGIIYKFNRLEVFRIKDGSAITLIEE